MDNSAKWPEEQQAAQFSVLGGQPLDTRDGAVLFVNRGRELRALRASGVL
jgi:hypothetical protein